MTKAATEPNLLATALQRYGQTFAAEAGIRLADKPAPLYQLLVLSNLLSARITAEIAVAAARELFAAGMRTPQRMVQGTWQQRVDALGRGHYRRYDERTATMLGNGAQQLIDQYRGDLRRLHRAAVDARELSALLQQFPGIGPAGADIFIREVQGIWSDLPPHFDQRTLDGAKLLGLPSSPEALADLVPRARLPELAAACIRATLDRNRAADARRSER